MSTPPYVSDLVNTTTGKTWRQENLEAPHTLPLGTLVEVDCPTSEMHGLRLFVSRHDGDCDGEALYALSPYNPTDEKSLLYTMERVAGFETTARYLHTGAFSANRLRVIRTADGKAAPGTPPSYAVLKNIANAAIDFHRSLMSDWAVPRPESEKTLRLGDALSDAYMPHWPQD